MVGTTTGDLNERLANATVQASNATAGFVIMPRGQRQQG